MSKRTKDCFVTRAECAATTGAIRSDLTEIKDDLKLVKTALSGEDMRGGLVKDVGDLKKSRGITVEIVRWLLTLLFVIFAFVLGKVWP
jgi:Tfp pilus assembly protein PilO